MVSCGIVRARPPDCRYSANMANHDPAATQTEPSSVVDTRPQFLGHPVGLFLLFTVEMWERFSYYGMRALLVLYLTSPLTGMTKRPEGFAEGFNPGLGWADADAAKLYGWYTGLAYLFPVIGGIIADKLIGTHRSMLVGGLLIMLGHIALAVSGMGDLHGAPIGTSVFIFGLALIILGTGHFEPSVSVMVGQLYAKGDPRRNGAFSIFYMGINLGAFLCAFVCGTLGERVGWHWGFGSAAVGMLLGLVVYTFGRPLYLRGIGEPKWDDASAGVDLRSTAPSVNLSSRKSASGMMVLFGIGGILVAAAFAWVFHSGLLVGIEKLMIPLVTISIAIVVFIAAAWFVVIQRPVDRGPTASIFIFMLFNAFFWFAFEQAGSSMTLFTDRFTDTSVNLPTWFTQTWDARGIAVYAILTVLGLAGAVISAKAMSASNKHGNHKRTFLWLLVCLASLSLLSAGILKWCGVWPSAAGFTDIPTTWFQSVNSAFILLLAPLFVAIWLALAKRRINANQPIKVGMGLILVGLGFVVLVMGARTLSVMPLPADAAADALPTVLSKASIFYLIAAYLLHTMGELCLSPTGLSYVTKTAPVRFVSLLMGIWFISSFLANLAAGLVAAQTKRLEQGQIRLPWNFSQGPGTFQADFFMLFVVTSIGAGVVILVFTPLLKKLMRNPND